MPAPVDHDSRRAQLAELATEIIAREGLQAATIRRLATEAGFSTAIVTHYFRNKRDLLFRVYEHVSTRAIARFNEYADATKSLREVLETFLPIGAHERMAYRVVFAFWALAQNDAEFASRQHLAMRQSRAAIATLLRERGFAGNVDYASDQLLVSIMGTAIRASFEPEWDDDYLRDFLGNMLELLDVPAV